MPVIEHRVQKVFAVYRVSSDLLYSWRLVFREDDAIEKLISFLHTDIALDDIINIIVRVEDFDLDVEEPGFTLDPYKVSWLLVEEFSIDVHLHVGTLLGLNGNPGNIGLSIPGNDG